MRIGLVGYFGFGNFGDELFVELYRQAFAGHDLTVLGGCDGVSGHDPEQVRRQDAIIIGGGDLIITDTYLDRYWDPVLLERPVLVAGVGVDFARTPEPAVVSRLAEFFGHGSVRSVTTRDRRSLEWVEEHLAPRAKPRAHADLVAALPFARNGVEVPTLGVVLRAGAEIDADGLSAVTASARHHGYVVKAIVLGTGITATEDRVVVEGLLNEGEEAVIRSSTGELTAELAGCDLVISQRLHGCLAAMLMGIPTVGLSTNGKFTSLFDEVGRSDDLLTLDDPRLPPMVAAPPRPLSAIEIAAIHKSAVAAIGDLVDKVLGFDPSRLGGVRIPDYRSYRESFLDGTTERAARRGELSPRLGRNPSARLRGRQELSWYRGEIRKRKGASYLVTIDDLIETNPILRELPNTTNAVVCIPVAGTSEHAHIYGTLSLYAQQSAAALGETVVLVYVNYPEDTIDDPERAERLSATLSQIESAHLDFPQVRLAVIGEAFDHRLPDRHRGIIGYIGRRLYDLAMMSVERAVAAGRIDSINDVLLIRNDADAVGMSRRYLERLLDAAARFPATDVFQGGIRWGTHRYRDYPGYGVVMSFKEALRALSTRARSGYASQPGTNGSNVAIRMASLAAVGGVGNSAYYGAGGDDVEIGLRIYAARRTRSHHAAPGAANRSGPRSGAEPARRRHIRYVSDAVIDTSGERALATYRSGHSVVETWDDFNKGPYGYRERSTVSNAALTLPERFDPSAIIDRIERNFNELTMAWYTDPALVDTALRCVIGSEDNEGRAVYRIESGDGGTRIRFTKAGRDWIVYRLSNTRHGVSDPYGRRLRRALYGEAATRRRAAPRLVSAL